MYPHERSLVKQLSDKPFAIVGVNSDKDREDTREVVKEKNLTWRSFWNDSGPEGKISDDWHIQGWPTVYVLDDKGIIRFKNVRGSDLDDALVTLLGEMGHEVEIEDHEESEDETDGEP